MRVVGLVEDQKPRKAQGKPKEGTYKGSNTKTTSKKTNGK